MCVILKLTYMKIPFDFLSTSTLSKDSKDGNDSISTVNLHLTFFSAFGKCT